MEVTGGGGESKFDELKDGGFGRGEKRREDEGEDEDEEKDGEDREEDTKTTRATTVRSGDRRVTMTFDNEGVFRRWNAIDLILGDLNDVGAGREPGMDG